MSSANIPSRNVAIDVIRGVAILLVLGFHSVTDESAGRLSRLQQMWHHIGWAGVDLFFVLSGFLVGGLLIKEASKTLGGGGIDIRRFVVRREFKILPSYYLYLIVLALVFAFRGDSVAVLWAYAVHLQNYVPHSSLPRELPHLWSLAVEEHFYVVLPFVLAWCARKPGRMDRTILWGVPALALFCLVARILTARHGAEYGTLGWSYRQQWPTHLRIDSLCVGVLFAWIFHRRESWRISPWLAGAVGAALVLPVVLVSNASTLSYVYGYSILALGFGLIVWASAQATVEAGRSGPFARTIAFIGVNSYSIYLWHILLGQIVPHAFQDSRMLASQPELRWLVTNALYIGCATLVGFLLSKAVEFPALKVRDRLFPSLTGNSIARANATLTATTDGA